MEKDVEEAESIPLRNIGKHSEAERAEEEVKERPSTMKQLFDQFDIDHTGNISIQELRSIINSGQHNFPEGVVRRIMQLADRDNSGHLDFEEFSTMIHHPELKQVFGRFVQRYVGFVVPPRHYTGAVTISRLSASDGKYKQEYSWWPPPVVMVLVSLLQITLYLVDELFFSDLKENGGAPVATWLLYSPYKRQEAWRFVTYMFVHLRLGHLIMNLLVQILIGIPLQMVHHWWRVLLVYGAGVLAGSLATSVFSPTDALVGASGGVFALYVANISSIVLNWSEMKHPLVSLMVFLLYFAGDIGANVMNRYPMEKPGNVGYTAHLAGVLAGLLVGIGVLRNLEVKSWENILWWVAVTLFLLLVSAAVCINIFWPGRFLDTRYLS